MGSFFEREAKSEPPVSEERSSCVSELATTWRRSTVGVKGVKLSLQRWSDGDGLEADVRTFECMKRT